MTLLLDLEDIPHNALLFNVDEFKQRMRDYAGVLFKAMTSKAKERKKNKFRSLEQLDPVLQELCGICSISEDDLNGDFQRDNELFLRYRH